MNSHKLKKFKSNQNGKSDATDTNSNGSGLKAKNGLRKCYDVVNINSYIPILITINIYL